MLCEENGNDFGEPLNHAAVIVIPNPIRNTNRPNALTIMNLSS